MGKSWLFRTFAFKFMKDFGGNNSPMICCLTRIRKSENPTLIRDKILLVGVCKMRMFLSLALLFLAMPLAFSEEKKTPVYELRIYYAAPGKLDALNARFRDHTCKLFEKHGMTNVGYWMPVDNKESKLVYIVAHKSREAAKQSWKAFIEDPDWQKAYKASEKDGKLVDKIVSSYLDTTEYSPAVKLDNSDKVYELRTYTTTPGNLDALNARFRNHTCKLFEKYGMTNLWYFTPQKDQAGAKDTLVYLLAHKSVAAAKESFDRFRMDPEWIKARTESEKKAGGSLTTEGGVKSEFMKATDYSPVK